jgi:hypothetical protein
MANVNIPDLAALTAPAATDEIEVYDASAAANVRLALSYVALTGTANANHLIVANGYAFQGIDANAGTRTLIQEAGLGYAEATYPGVRVGETGNHIALFVNPSANSGNQFSGNINELLLPNDTRVLVENSGSTAWQTAGRILDTHWMIGTTTDAGQVTVNGELAIVDGMTAPSATSGWAKIYVDSADGDLKVKFGDGTVKTLATDT